MTDGPLATTDTEISRGAVRWSRRGDTLVLLLILLPILALTAFGAVKLWPHGEPPLAAQIRTGDYDTADAVVRSTRPKECPGTVENRLPNGDIPAEVTCAYAGIRLTSGPDRDREITVAVPTPVFRSGIEPGTRIQLTRYPPLEGIDDSLGTVPSGDVYVWQDYSRSSPLTWMAITFAVLVVHRPVHAAGPALR